MFSFRGQAGDANAYPGRGRTISTSGPQPRKSYVVTHGDAAPIHRAAGRDVLAMGTDAIFTYPHTEAFLIQLLPSLDPHRQWKRSAPGPQVSTGPSRRAPAQLSTNKRCPNPRNNNRGNAW